MNRQAEPVPERVVTLRRAFDRDFAVAPIPAAGAFDDFLAIRAGGVPHAIYLSDIAGLYADRKVVPFPCPAPELLGIAGFRNLLAPVYDLRALLGYRRGGPPRWIVLVRAKHPVCLAFDLFESHLRAPREQVSSESRGSGRHLDGALLADPVRPILHLASLLEAIAGLVAPPGAQKER